MMEMDECAKSEIVNNHDQWAKINSVSVQENGQVFSIKNVVWN